jgi:hypothetical protein
MQIDEKDLALVGIALACLVWGLTSVPYGIATGILVFIGYKYRDELIELYKGVKNARGLERDQREE